MERYACVAVRISNRISLTVSPTAASTFTPAVQVDEDWIDTVEFANDEAVKAVVLERFGDWEPALRALASLISTPSATPHAAASGFLRITCAASRGGPKRTAPCRLLLGDRYTLPIGEV